VSQHLAKLRLAGLVGSRREGRRVIYTVDDPHVVTMVEEIFEHIAPDGPLAPDPDERRPQRRSRRRGPPDHAPPGRAPPGARGPPPAGSTPRRPRSPGGPTGCP